MNFSLFRKLRDSSLPSPTRFVAILLLDAVGANESTFISIETLCLRSGYSRTAVKAALTNLHDLGLINRKFEGRKTMNCYFAKEDAPAWIALANAANIDWAVRKKGSLDDRKNRDRIFDDGRDTTVKVVGRRPDKGSGNDHKIPIEIPNEIPSYVAVNIEVVGNREILQSEKVALQRHSPFQESFDLYNETAARCGWTIEPHFTATHDRLFSELRNAGFTADEWKEGLRRASNSEFIASNKRKNWPTLKWFLAGDGLMKTLEGSYDELHDFSQRAAVVKPEPSPAPMTQADLMKNIDHLFAKNDQDDEAMNARPVQPTQADAAQLPVAAWRQWLAEAERQGEVELAATFRSMIDNASVPAIH